LGRERGWPPVTKGQFDSLIGPKGVLVVGGPERVAEKLLGHSEALGGIDRFTFQMDNAGLTHAQLMTSIELIGTKVIPLVKGDS
jgi:alkanesulfonate monooxygenase SsuD/methylene tetrahydromethanopterin reductase-like flavin-dependent oxidoreductase (luciferase family)